ncbi:MBL fold metallo-hydrolase [Desulfobacter hydrogenophilus]|nr:MBL fold metallo-hydrolase [Desulfobacter hydrogenophilus]NDY74165.1 MBL fold metallo-hydrolase [Desulfobacter hydrogenophilus]
MKTTQKTYGMSRRNFMTFAGGAMGFATIAATGVPIGCASSKSKVEDTSQQSGAVTPANQEGMSVNPYPVNPSRISPKSYEHKGDFTVMTVGTGCPDTIVGRSGPSTLVQYKGNYFLVDIGAGTTFRLVEAGIHLDRIKNILITHMHTDHTDGYSKFMVESWTLGRRDTDIFGVKGVNALHNIFATVFPEDIKYRLGKTATVDGMYEKVNITELEGANTFTLDGVEIRTLPTIHAVYNLAYRFDVDGNSIVVSGDTSYSENLITLSKNADILVVDSGRVVNKRYMGPGEMKPPPGGKQSGPPAAANPATYVPKEVQGKSHASLEDVAIMAAKANVKKIVLTHYPPFEVDIETTLKQYKRFYNGEVIFGQDLLEVKP